MAAISNKEAKKMNAITVVVGVIGITIGLYVVADTLLPAIAQVTGDGGAAEDYAPILSLLGLLAIFILVMWAVRMMGSAKN